MAQATYPARSIRIVSPFAAGGTNDYLARVVGRTLTEAWGQSVVVENRPGAGGNIGSEVVARAAPDGYTLLMGSVTTHAINPALYTALPFSAQRDFAPVTGVAATQTVLVVHPSVPAHSLKELVALAKSRRQLLNYGSAGHGSISHMAAELFSYTTGAKMTHVPYKGEGQAPRRRHCDARASADANFRKCAAMESSTATVNADMRSANTLLASPTVECMLGEVCITC